MGEMIHIFSNGTEYEWWFESNCARCPVDWETCELNVALFTDTPGGGPVKPETAARLGYSRDVATAIGSDGLALHVLDWPCAERLRIVNGPPPAAHEMAKAGAAMLPGFDAPTPGATHAREGAAGPALPGAGGGR